MQQVDHRLSVSRFPAAVIDVVTNVHTHEEKKIYDSD